MESSCKGVCASVVAAIGSGGLIVWSSVVWNFSGYDYPLWPGVIDLASIGGWLLGWLLFTPSCAVLLLLTYLRRRRS